MKSTALIKLSKLDCARRQLEMAIELFFMDRDPVSIHTLGSAARQLIADVNRHRGGRPMLTELDGMKGYVIPGKEKEVRRIICKAENFFKHADWDPQDTLEFGPLVNPFVLWEASVKYIELTSERIRPMEAMIIWHQLQNPDLFTYEQWNTDDMTLVLKFFQTTSKKDFYKEFVSVGSQNQPLVGG